MSEVVQYIIVRRDIADKMGEGFTAAQIAHASMAPITSKLQAGTPFDKETQNWISGTFKKLVLEVKGEKELSDLINNLSKKGIEYSAINESSLNGTLTSIGLKPYEKSDVEKLLKFYPLFGRKEQIQVFVDDTKIKPSEITYHENSIDCISPDLTSRFSINIDYAKFEKDISEQFKRYMTAKKLMESTYCKDSKIPKLEHIKRNEPDFNLEFLRDNYQKIIGTVLPTAKNPKYTITSLEGIFYIPSDNSVSIVGGCSPTKI